MDMRYSALEVEKPERIDFILRDAAKVAEKVGGVFGLTRTGRLAIALPDDVNAATVAAGITNDDFPYGSVEAEDYSTLAFVL